MSRRALDPINLLAVTVLLMLAYHPLDLYNAGFQLSFGTVLGLMVLAPEFVAFLQGLQDRDLRLATQAKDLTPAMAAARATSGWAGSGKGSRTVK